MTSAARTIASITSSGKSMVSEDDWGPGPPPPPFRIPPPPLPEFMLPEDLHGEARVTFCQKTTIPNSLDSQLASCDTTFPSIKSTSGLDDSTLTNWMTLVLGAVGLLFLLLCLAIFVAWRRWRSRNRLSYLRSKSSYDSACQPTESSEHPLIYDDANIHFFRANSGAMQPTLGTTTTSSYLLDHHHHHRPIVRDTSGLSQQSYDFGPTPSSLYNGYVPQNNLLHLNDNESRIYEEVLLNEDPYGGHYSRPLEQPDSAFSSIKRMLFRNNEADNGTNDLVMVAGYSSVYNPAIPSNNALLVESSFSTATTASSGEQPPSQPPLRPNLSLSGHSSSLSGRSSIKAQPTQRCCQQQHHHQRCCPTATISSSSCSCSSSSCPEDNGGPLMLGQQPLPCVNTKENGKYSPPACRLESPGLWPPPRNNNLVSRGCRLQQPATLQKEGTRLIMQQQQQPQQTWNKNNVVVVQSRSNDDNNFGIFSSLWRKRSRTAKAKPQTMSHVGQPQTQSAQPPWMTLRVAPPLQFDQHSSHNFERVLAQSSRPLNMQSKTLGRAPTSSSSCNHVVMPNPDDILPKEAWTDFSGTDEWPRFSQGHDDDGRDNRSSQESSSTAARLYVNCSSTDAKQEDEDNGNVRHRRSESESNNNGPRQPRNEDLVPLQQIESSLMAARNDQQKSRGVEGKSRHQERPPAPAAAADDMEDKRRPRPKPLPPPRSNCIKQHEEDLQRKRRKKHRTKRHVSQSKGNGLGGHHANDDEESSANGSSLYESSSDEGEAKSHERSPLFTDMQWQTSPL